MSVEQTESLKVDRVTVIWVKSHRISASTGYCSVQSVASDIQKALLGALFIREDIHTKTNHPPPPGSFSGKREEIICDRC